jgi:hypothetical protein
MKTNRRLGVNERRRMDVVTQVAIITLTVMLTIVSGVFLTIVINKKEDEDRNELLKSNYTKLIKDVDDSCDIRVNRINERLDSYQYTTDMRLREVERKTISSNDNNK